MLNRINKCDTPRIKFNKICEGFMNENKKNIIEMLNYLKDKKIFKIKINIVLIFDILRQFILFSKSLSLKKLLIDHINQMLLDLIKTIKESIINKEVDKNEICNLLENSFKNETDYKNIVKNNFQFIFNFELKYSEYFLDDILKTKSPSVHKLEITLFIFSQMVLFFEEFFKPKNYKQTFRDFYDFLFMASFTSKYQINDNISFDKKNALRVKITSLNSENYNSNDM